MLDPTLDINSNIFLFVCALGICGLIYFPLVLILYKYVSIIILISVRTTYWVVRPRCYLT